MSAAARGSCYYPLGSLTALLASRRESGDDLEAWARPEPAGESGVNSTGRGRRPPSASCSALGILTVRDLLMHLPFRHELPSRIGKRGRTVPGRRGHSARAGSLLLGPGDEPTARQGARGPGQRRDRQRHRHVVQPGLSGGCFSAAGRRFLSRGVLMRKRGGSTFIVKRHEILDAGEESRHILGLVPVYPSAGDLSVRTIRTLLHRAAPELRHMVDPLPAEMLARKGYAGRAEAVWASHFPLVHPGGRGCASDGWSFEELLLTADRRASAASGCRSPADGAPAVCPFYSHHAFVHSLPYQPTAAQTQGDRRDRRGPGRVRSRCDACCTVTWGRERRWWLPTVCCGRSSRARRRAHGAH